jgi:hypothetical protein
MAASELLCKLFVSFCLELFELCELPRAQDFGCLFTETGLDFIELLKSFLVIYWEL